MLSTTAWRKWEAACFSQQYKLKAALLRKVLVTGDGTHCEGVDFEELQDFLSHESGAWIEEVQNVVENVQLQYTRLGEKSRESVRALYNGRRNSMERQRLTDSIRVNVQKIQVEIAESVEVLEAALGRDGPLTISSKPRRKD
jgi:hypothetical protein